MNFNINDRIPDATFNRLGNNGAESVTLYQLIQNRKVILFGLPGAFTPTCSQDHLPSFIKNVKRFKEKGVDEILCVVVNDVHVAAVWGEQTGATNAGISILTDPTSKFVKCLGVGFSVPALGLYDRFQRFVLVIDKKTIKQTKVEEVKGACDLTTGDHILSILN